MIIPPDRELAIFSEARRLSVSERAAYLDQVCAGDAAFRRRIEQLLQANEEVGGFLETPASATPPILPGAGAPKPGETIRSAPAPTEKPGDRIGRYRLLQQIGEGGCGVVYMAEQEEPVRRRVALKVIKLGMDTRQVIARFEAERQTLALMDHPNIAKVLDAGATDAGRPYFVMELVRGIKVTDYCDENNLSTPERLTVFIQICRAIQHAHQKGIIHRDIKPSNVLVTMNDGVPLPKVIDFGIAKATHGKLTDQTVFTAFEQFIGTPAYMSPEQAGMNALDIDTRSDIYSLGVLLYELLTGRTPFDAKKLVQAGLDEIRRVIRHDEPARPSTCLSTTPGADLTRVASHRRTEPPRLIHLVRGDLDWIVMKALEKDRTRRYETANGLATDIERHLSNEPVVACPPSKLYKFQKMVRRNKLACFAGSAVVLALGFSMVVLIWLLVRERQIREIQEGLRVQAETVSANEAGLLRKAETRVTIADAKTLYDSQKYAEAETLLDGIDPAQLGPDSMHAAVRRGLAWQYVAQNQWNKALTNAAMLVQVDGLAEPQSAAHDNDLYAAALVETGDFAAYDRFRHDLVGRYAGTTDPVIADVVCMVTLLRPADDALMRELNSFYAVAARQTFRRDGNMDPKIWNHLALALIDYRRGDYTNAAKWCVGALARSQQKNRIPTALALRAMVHHQLHEEEEARLELAYAREAIEPAFPKELSENNWAGFEEARILLREATTLIGEPSAPVQLTPFDANAKMKATRNLIGNNHYQEAGESISNFPNSAIEMEVQNSGPTYRQLGLHALGAGQRRAAAAYWRVSLFGPNDEGSLDAAWDLGFDAMAYAPLTLELGDQSSYEKLRLLLVDTLSDADDAGTAERALKTCLLLPIDTNFAAQLNPFVDLLRHTPSADPSWYPWANLTLGLYEYREGDYAQTLQLVPTDSVVEFQDPAVRPALKATAHLLTGMALAQLHQTEAAKREIAEYGGVIETNFNGPLALGSDLGKNGYGIAGPWHNWWIGHVLLREARTMIDGETNAPTVDAKSGGN
jgi:tetratricopeptide (TPR) repeat protein